MYFGLCGIKVKDDITYLNILGGMQQCRGFINDGIVSLKKNGHASYLPNLSFMDNKGVYVLVRCFHNEDNLITGIKMINKKERMHGWFRTQVKDVESNITKYKLLIVSKNWFVNLINMSLFMLLVRNVIAIKKDDYFLEDVYKLCKDVGSAHNNRYFSDDKETLERVSRNTSLVNFIMKNNKKLNEAFCWKDIQNSHSCGVGEVLKWYDKVNEYPSLNYLSMKSLLENIKTYGLEKYTKYIQDNKSANG
jgi:hypothetical protein